MLETLETQKNTFRLRFIQCSVYSKHRKASSRKRANV